MSDNNSPNQSNNKAAPIHNLVTDTTPQHPKQGDKQGNREGVSRRHFLQSSAVAGVAGVGLVGCGSDNGGGFTEIANHLADSQSDNKTTTARIQFLHGVASGDPLADRVILWTRVTPQSAGSRITVKWQVAQDQEFRQITAQGSTNTDGSQDYTVKVDATGLNANTAYFYRFMVGETLSPVGKTKTLPVGNVDQVKLAVVSCSNYPAGYFHAYADIAKRSDVDVVVHLGDYIYEYGRTTTTDNGSEVPAYASAQAKALGREVLPAQEIISTSDYRKRYAQYRTDKDLQAVHAALPMIAVWDDHEITNDTYKDGAENHQANEGDWHERKLAAMRAYHEWMPIRRDVVSQIYRSFDFGDLLSLHMLDTRVIARDKQLDYQAFMTQNAAGEISLDGEKLTKALSDPNRQMIGLSQQNWLFNQLQRSNATWQLLGQQVIMGQMYIPAPVLLNFMNPTLGMDAVSYMTLAQKAQQDPTALTPQEQTVLSAPAIPYNLDAWDGYAVAREQVYALANNLQKNLVVLSGDTHNAWANNLKNAKGEAVGVEFATPSVSSPGFEAYLPNFSPQLLSLGLPSLVQGGTLKWCDTSQRGYMLVTVTPTQCTSDWVFVSDVTKTTYSSSVGKTLSVKVDEPMLV